MKEETRQELSVWARVIPIVGIGSWVLSYVLALIAGLGTELIFEADAPGWFQGFAAIGKWVAGVVAVLAMIVWRVAANPREPLSNAELMAAGWSEPQFGRLEIWFAGRVLGPMGVIYGAGILLRANIEVKDTGEGWFAILAGLAAAIAAEVWCFRRQRRDRELDVLAKDGIITVGRLESVGLKEGEDVVNSSRAKIAFTNSVGTLLKARGWVDGEPAPGTPFEVLYLPAQPKIRPIIRPTDRKRPIDRMP